MPKDTESYKEELSKCWFALNNFLNSLAEMVILKMTFAFKIKFFQTLQPPQKLM